MMFNKFAAVMMTACLLAAAVAAELPRIAVYVTGDVPENEKSALGTRMLASLVNSGRYRGIERSSAFLSEIEREQAHQRSGAIDDGQISALGRQFGVRYVCIATIMPAFGEFQVSARIVDVETAEVVHIGESFSSLRTGRDLVDVSNTIVTEMFARSATPAAPTTTPAATPTPEIVAEPAPESIVIPAPEVRAEPERSPASAIAADAQTAAPRETNRQNQSRLRLALRVSTATLVVGGIVGGVVFDGRANDEYQRYRDYGTADDPRGTDAENPDRVREMHKTINDAVLMRNVLYGVAGIGLAGFTLTLFF